MGEAMKPWLWTLLGLMFAGWTELAHAASTAPRRVVVAEFEAPAQSRARNAVLETLSDHTDVEVVSLDDVEFTSKRIKADPKTSAGRAKIATELGVDAWIDGRVDGLNIHLKLSSASGRRMAEADAHGATDSLLDVLAGEKMWAAMGPSLSERERRRRTLLSQGELARTKIADRHHEQDRQRTVALEHEAQRLERLKAEHDLARKKQAAVASELARQEQLVKDRIAQDTKEQEDAAERRRRAEMRRLAQVPIQRGPSPSAYEQPAQPSAWGGHGAYAAGYGTGAAPADAAMGQPSAAGVSSSTQRWLASQQAAPVAPAAPAAPGPSYGSAAPVADPGLAAVGGGVSPATARWLAQQQLH
jgi:hypothetical protein